MTQKELFGKCPIATAQKVLSGKWALVVLHQLSTGALRFGELQRALPDLTQATLAKQLRSLEEHGLVVRRVVSQIPPKSEYALSEIGAAFQKVLDSLEEWGEAYIRQMEPRDLRPLYDY